MANGAYSHPQGNQGAASIRGDILPAAMRRISWGGIFAGVAVTAISQLLFSLLGLGIGLSTINPTGDGAPVMGLSIGAGIWWVVSSLISLFIGGWVAGRMAGMPRAFDGVLHGVLTWAIATFLLIYFLGTAMGSLFGGALNVVKGSVSTASRAAIAAGPEGMEKAKEALPTSPAAMVDTVKKKAEQVMRNPETKQMVQEKGEQAAKGASMASFFSFVVILLGGVSAGLGGKIGSPKETRPVKDTHA